MKSGDSGNSDRWLVVTQKQHIEFIKSHLPNAEITENMPEGGGAQLICFGTGLIIPKEVLSEWTHKINFHGAPPGYPGRDPHHWACYDDARHYGAVAHEIWPRVDEGPICGQILLGINGPISPDDYCQVGQVAMYALFSAWCSTSSRFSFDARLSWTGTKHARSDLLALCDFRGISLEEKERRRRAFSGFEQHFIE